MTPSLGQEMDVIARRMVHGCSCLRHDVRSLSLLALLAALFAIGWLVVWEPGAPTEARTVEAQVIGPTGLIWNGTVAAATALEALQAAAQAGDFEVLVQGAGRSAFVTSVAGHPNQGVDGWCFFTLDQGHWSDPPVSAGIAPVQDGVRWEYRMGGCPNA